MELFLVVLEAGSPEASVVEFCEGSLLGCRLPTFLCVLTWWRGEGSLSGLFIRTLIAFLNVPSSWPNHLPKSLPPNTIVKSIRISTHKFWKVETFRT